jgi:HSP20 family protein
MNITRWRSPAQQLSQMEARMQKMLESPFPFPFFAEEIGWNPTMDVTETEKTIEVTAELPGVAREDVEIDLRDDILTIRGEKKAENEVKRKERYMLERYYGSFQRSFTLPAPVDPEKVEAEFADGVLKIHMEKSGRANGRRIPIGR